MASIYGSYDAIQTKIHANELRITETLQVATENYRRELRANIDYHRHLAKAVAESGDSNIALRHNLLAEIYQSLLDRA